ncbi:MAG TPA: glycosyltransferase family 25 protein [Gammaproteobacteria bacterium]
MRTHVISLVRSLARRATSRACLDPLGVDYVFFDAIAGDQGRESFGAYDDAKYLINTGRRPIPGEIGCHASHLALWKLCASQKNPLVIMEDDAEPERNFVAALAATEYLVQRYGFVRLQSDGPNRQCPKKLIAIAGEFSLYYYEKYPYGAMCYALSPSAARALVAASGTLTGPVDLFIRRFWKHGQPLYGLSPHAVKAGPHSAQSTIPGRAKDKTPAGLRIRRLLHKAKSALDRASFNKRYLSERSAGDVAVGPAVGSRQFVDMPRMRRS